MVKSLKNALSGMMKTQKISLFLIIFALFTTSGCKPSHPHVRYFASALGKEIKILVCKEKYNPTDPCGIRDVKVDADLGKTVYLNINGVIDEKEIQSIVDAVTAFRGTEYKTIPIEITFYDAFIKYSLDNNAHIRTNSKVIYKITLKGEI
ncbi:MAG: hypothetical protein HQL10_12285 [Nitrospirae bacterium]|nr:hypothetical protein [Nitrospirota bacterium]